MKRYTKTHEYVSLDGDVAAVGISIAAAEDLGDLVHIELPDVGAALIQGEPFCTVESVKATQDIYAPVSGEVVEINDAALADNELVTGDPEGRGWLLKVRPADMTELEALLESDAPIG